MRQQQCAQCRACGETFVAIQPLKAEGAGAPEGQERCPYCTTVRNYNAEELFFA